MSPVRRAAHVTGAVQGVGFRPHVFRAAVRHGVTGWVRNGVDGVRLEVEGEPGAVEAFLVEVEAGPRAAVVGGVEVEDLPPLGTEDGFRIEHSGGGARALLPIGPDLATCPACLAELRDPTDRRYRYPFLNCTDCGPRYSILRALPYDRPNTTMAGFPMCPACAAEYADPADRRFHAQPTACPACGPRLELLDDAGASLALADEALERAVAGLAAGQVVAVLGIGGVHLLCDATDEGAVASLRARKRRGAKPLAVMFPDLMAVRAAAVCGADEAAELGGPAAPILLLPRRGGALDPAGRSGGEADPGPGGARGAERGSPDDLAPGVAPGSPYLGCLLPYAPVHHLLLGDLGRPVVATSGNLADEPLCTAPDEAVARLAGIADLFLVHDRPIARPVDDSVVLAAGGERIPIRRARGFAPLALALPVAAAEGAERSGSPGVDRPPASVAVGAHEKNTVAWRVGDELLVSPHIGDLDGPAGRDHQRAILTDLGDLLEVAPGAVVRDRHDDYASTLLAEDLAEERGLAPVRVQHHLAHALACLVDAGHGGPALAVTWDGTGAGPDGTVWGGEVLAVDARDPGRFERVAHLEPFPLVGGAAAVREPRRVASALLHLAFGEAALAALDGVAGEDREPTAGAAPAGVPEETSSVDGDPAPLLADLPTLAAFEPREAAALAGMLRAGGGLTTSSVGRLFDGVASLLGLPQVLAFEGEAAMQLEYLAREAAGADGPADGSGALAARLSYPTQLGRRDGRRVLPTAELVRAVVADLVAGTDRGAVALRFHHTLAGWIGDLADRLRDRDGARPVGLTGGCFQNALLLRLVRAELEARGHGVLVHRQLPPNDGSIAVGQALALGQANTEPGSVFAWPSGAGCEGRGRSADRSVQSGPCASPSPAASTRSAATIPCSARRRCRSAASPARSASPTAPRPRSATTSWSTWAWPSRSSTRPRPRRS